LVRFLSPLSLRNPINSINWICSEVQGQKDDSMKTQVARYLKERLPLHMPYFSITNNDETAAVVLGWCFELGLQNIFQEWLATVATEIPSLTRRLLAKLIASDSSQLIDGWGSW